MAKPLIPVESIYDAALELLEEEGPQALSARSLAARLKCSTRTLYQQVGKRDALISGLIAYFLAGQELQFQRAADWNDTAWHWASTLRGALLAHPNLSRLMTLEHRAPISGYVTELLRELLHAGFDEELALRSARVLVNVTMSLTLSELIAPASAHRRATRSPKEIQFEDLIIERAGADRDHFQEPPDVFENAVKWTIQGIRTELQQQA